MRDEFPMRVKETLAKRVGNRCSNCGSPTSGPHDDPSTAVNIGVASHITAAAPGGPRYLPQMTPVERKGIENGIWLCQNCAKMVDNDPIRYTAQVLAEWKANAEIVARQELEARRMPESQTSAEFDRIRVLMPELFEEMRKDLRENPYCREFVVLSKGSIYCANPHKIELMYFRDEHPQLENKLQIVENCGFIRDVTCSNVPRYVMTEEFADFLHR